MLNVSEAVKQKYLSDEFNGDYKLVIGETTYTGRNVQQGSIEIVESLCSGDDFDLSAVEKGEIQFTLINFTENIKDIQGASLTATQTVAGEDVPLGVYTITNAQYSGEYLLDVTAHDNLTLLDRDITDWWNNTVTFPITHRNLLIGLCNYCGVQYDIPAAYTNSTLSIEKAFSSESVKGLDLLGWLQEVSASFYRCDRNGVLVARTIRTNNLVPRVGLYPHTGLYPGSERTDAGTGADQRYTVSHIVSDLEIADYMTKHIDKLQISSTNDDIGVIVGDGTNTYRIVANPLLYAIDTATLESVASNIYRVVRGINYRPFKAKLKGLPYLETGDVIQLTTLKGIKILEPILKRTMSGSGLAYDLFENIGKEKRVTVSAVNKTYKVLNMRSHELINTVDELRSTVTEAVAVVEGMADTVETHTTEIAQNANSINLSAKRSGIFNLLINSDFTDQSDRTRGWEWYDGVRSREYVYDDKFIGTSSDFNKNENGNCLKLTLNTVGSATYAYFYQDINVNGTLSEYLQMQFTCLFKKYDGTTTLSMWVRALDASKNSIASELKTFDIVDFCGCYRAQFSSLRTGVLGRTVATLRVGIYFGSISSENIVEINHILATFTTNTTFLPFYSWTNYASKDIISQINIEPTGITIQGEKIDIKGITTFSSSSSGTTVIDGGTVNVKNLNASNITSGSMSASKISGGTLTLGGSNNVNGQLTILNASGTTIGTWNNAGITITGGTINSPTINAGDMYWYKGTANQVNITQGSQTVQGTTYYGAIMTCKLLAVKATSGSSMFTVNNGASSAGVIWCGPSASVNKYGDYEVRADSSGASMVASRHVVQVTNNNLKVATDGLTGLQNVGWVSVNGYTVLGII